MAGLLGAIAGVSWFEFEITEWHGVHMNQLLLSSEDETDLTYALHEEGNLLRIVCFWNHFAIRGFLVDQCYDGKIKILESGFEESISVPDCPDDYVVDVDVSPNLQTFYKDVDNQDSKECIPEGLRVILEGQDWYDLESGSCDASFERNAGIRALVLSILALIFPGIYMVIFKLWYGCCDFSQSQEEPVSNMLSHYIWPGLCMVGVLVSVIPFGQDNMCGQQGNDSFVHTAIIWAVIVAIGCSLYISIPHIIVQCCCIRRRNSFLINNNSVHSIQ